MAKKSIYIINIMATKSVGTEYDDEWGENGSIDQGIDLELNGAHELIEQFIKNVMSEAMHDIAVKVGLFPRKLKSKKSIACTGVSRFS